MKWPLVPLGEVARIERQTVDPSAIALGTAYIGLEHIESSGDTRIQTDVEFKIKSTKFRFTNEHLLFGKLRPYLRKIARPQFAGVCSTDIVPIRPGNTINKDFLFYVLRADDFIDKAVSFATGVNLPRISPSILEQLEIPVPPLAEQRRIAKILDQANELRCNRGIALISLDRLAQNTFLEIFGDPLRNSKHWRDDIVLGDTAEIVSGLTKGRPLNGLLTKQIPYLAVANVQDKILRLDNIKTIDATDEEIARLRLRRDDLLLTEGGDPDKLGRGTLWQDEIEECIHQNHVFRVRLRVPEVTPLFLNWLVGSIRGKRYFLQSAKQTTGIASINMSQLRAFPMLVPPIDVQQSFASRITEIDALKTHHRIHLARLDALFAALQHRAFRGEL